MLVRRFIAVLKDSGLFQSNSLWLGFGPMVQYINHGGAELPLALVGMVVNF